MAQKEGKATRIGDHMSNRLVTIDSDTSAFEIAKRMMEKQVSAVIVVDSGNLSRYLQSAS